MADRTVYFYVPWEDETNEEFTNDIVKQTPNRSGKWNDIRATLSSDSADYHVAFNRPSEMLDEEKLLLFWRESPVFFNESRWNRFKAKYKVSYKDCLIPQRWWIKRDYDELSGLNNMSKNKDLSWITTDKGRNIGRISRFSRRLVDRFGINKYSRKGFYYVDRRATDGHVHRMDFLRRMDNNCPTDFDLFGRGQFTEDSYRGEISDKWDGLSDYRYSIAVENYRGPNYFSEKIVDALLAWCMPIYWGCTNLDVYLPENSYVEIDITDPNAPGKVEGIVNSNLREENMDAIAKARELILDEYQIWPMVEQTIEVVESVNK